MCCCEVQLLDWRCVQIKSLQAEKKKIESDVNGLEKKVKDVLKGQGSRDALIETLQGRIHELQQQIDGHKVSASESV